jgi:PAS domain S-box-containing protein
MKKQKILIIDDDKNIRKTLSDILKVKGYEPLIAINGTEGLEILSGVSVDLVIIDLGLPDMSGLEVLKRVKTDHPSTEAIILTGNASLDSAIDATNKGAFSYLLKPYEIDQLMIHIRRAIEKSEAREALNRSEMYFRSLIENSSDIITILDADSTIRYESLTVKRILGYEPSELIGRNVFEFIHPDDLTAVSDAFSSAIQKPGVIISIEHRFRDNDGSWRILESIGQNLLENEAVKGIVINSHDISERKKILSELQKKNLELAEAYEELRKKQEMIIQQEKMASIGVLAAGTAHEIKNPLAIILQGIGYLQENITDNSMMVEVIERLNKAILRADKIVKGLISYSRQHPLSLTKEDITALVDESLVLTEHEFRKKNLEVIRQYAPGLPKVSVDVNQIKQVFVNVLINGIDAMSPKGIFIIAVRQIEDNAGKDALQISFKDTGTGIPEDKIHKIFDPFYTTKGVGNTGLGLSVSKGIIDSHGGIIYAESEIGQGTNIFIELPIPHYNT